jgi:replicative DNA helicase
MIADLNQAPFSKNRKISVQLEGIAPIYSEEAERDVLGAMLADPEQTMDSVMERLRPEDFFNPAYQILFKCLLEMREKSLPIDPMTVLQYLEDHKVADSVGGASVITDLAAGVLSVLSAPTRIETVRSKSLLRQLQQACARIVYSAQETQHDVPAVLDNAEKAIFEITERGITKSVVGARAAVYETLGIIERRIKRKALYDGIPSGFDELDAMTTGFKEGEMIVIAARPGMGKTAIALTMALNALKRRYDDDTERFVEPGFPVGFFSLEMTAQQLMLRVLAASANIPLSSISEGKLKERDLSALTIVAEQIADLPFYIDQSSQLTIGQFRAKARRMVKDGVKCIIVDYLQLLSSSSDKARDNRQVEMAEVSRGIKSLALEMKIPIIALAQLNRKPDETSNGEPALHHLRESGSIEQDADIVLLLSRVKDKDGEDETTEDHGAPVHSKLIIAKHRNGPTGKVDLLFQRAYTRFDSFPRTAK